MSKNSSRRKLFTKHGRELKSYKDLESVTSLVTLPESEPPETIFYISNDESENKEGRLKPKLFFQTLKSEIGAIRESKIFVLPSIWLVSNTVLSLFVIFLLANIITSGTNSKSPKYSIFSSKPLTLGATSIRLFGGDSRAAVLDNIFEAYNCPLEGKGKIFVQEADRNDIPFWVVPSIAFQESSCGRATPAVEGSETFNAWGWAVWGDNTHMFSSWDEGIKIVSKYINEEFFSKGITDPCEIMKTYTPPSKGSWCDGVNYFKDIIENYRTPE